MIKFNAGFQTDRDAHLLGFGLSEMNLVRLLQNNEPIVIHAEDVGLPLNSVQFLLFAGENKEDIELRAKSLLDVIIAGQPEQEISCLHIDQQFFVIPVPGDLGKILYLVGLDSQSYATLRDGKCLTFRARSAHPQGTNVEVLLFGVQMNKPSKITSVNST